MMVYVVTVHGCGECEPSKVVGVFHERRPAEVSCAYWSSRKHREMADDRPIESRDSCCRTTVHVSEHEIE